MHSFSIRARRRRLLGLFLLPSALLLLGAPFARSQQQPPLTAKEIKRHYDRAQKLYRRHAHSKSLEEYRIVLNNSRGGGPADVGGLGLLPGLAELGRVYAPARQALVERRNEMQREVLAGAKGIDLIPLLVRVNKDMLGEPQQNITLHDELARKGPEYAKAWEQLINLIWPQMLEAKRYAELRARTAQPDDSAAGAPGLLVADFRLAPDIGLSSSTGYSPLFASAAYLSFQERPMWYPYPARFHDPDPWGRYKYIRTAGGGKVLYVPGGELYPRPERGWYLPTMWVANTGAREIKAVEWEYQFYESEDGRQALKSYRKKSEVDLQSGGYQLLFMTPGVKKELWQKVQGAKVRRVEYSDGTAWEAEGVS